LRGYGGQAKPYFFYLVYIKRQFELQKGDCFVDESGCRSGNSWRQKRLPQFRSTKFGWIAGKFWQDVFEIFGTKIAS